MLKAGQTVRVHPKDPIDAWTAIGEWTVWSLLTPGMWALYRAENDAPYSWCAAHESEIEVI